MLELCTLASGSSGNAVLVFNETTALLIDAGISAKRICDGLRQLGMGPERLDAICITHSHSDHISGLRVLLKRVMCPVYATEATGAEIARQVEGAASRLHTIRPQEPVTFGSLRVQAFSHSPRRPGQCGLHHL